ncbi:hypothetical protein Tco_0789520 [Tanacetum coccineum]
MSAFKVLHTQFHRVNERQNQTTEEKTDTSNVLDASSVIIESNGTESKEQDTSSRSGNEAQLNADIIPINDVEPWLRYKQLLTSISCLQTQHTDNLNSINEGEVDRMLNMS